MFIYHSNRINKIYFNRQLVNTLFFQPSALNVSESDGLFEYFILGQEIQTDYSYYYLLYEDEKYRSFYNCFNG